MRRLELPGSGKAVLADTVGFIRDLPTPLVEAFKATLEEVLSADLLLQVVDVTDPAAPEQEAQVNAVLAELGAQEIPKLLVSNKVDAIAEGHEPVFLEDREEQRARIGVSARTGLGLDTLRAQIAVALGQDAQSIQLTLAPAQGRTRAWLHELQAVTRELVTETGGWQMWVLLNDSGQRKLRSDGVDFSASTATPTDRSIDPT